MSGLFTAEKMNECMVRIKMLGGAWGYYLEGMQAGLLVDTGFGYGDLKGFVDTFATKPYEVAITHGHVDHAGGTVQFPKVYINKQDLSLAEAHTELTFRINFVKQTYKDVADSEFLPAKPVEEYLLMEDEKEFDLGGFCVRFVSLAGHTPGSMVALIPKFRTMILGDALNSMTFLQMPESVSVEAYRQNLIRFKENYKGQYEHALYSHPHNTGEAEIVDEMLELCDEVIQDPSGSVDMSDSFGKGARIAKPFDSITYQRSDGKSANLIYRQ